MSIPWITVVVIITAIMTSVTLSQRSSEVITEYPEDLVESSENFENSTDEAHIKNYSNYEHSVFFKFYKDGIFTYLSNGVNVESISDTGCLPTDKFAFLIHGWRESCEVEWMMTLIGKLTTHRGGCIICIDYGLLAEDSYVRLFRKFEPLSNIITSKLKYLNTQGFNPANGYMFGFSFGGQLASTIGKKFGVKTIKEIDTCDMAGPGFDHKTSMVDHRDAAQNVQCIHTSGDKGTRNYKCHQNWRMGNCGISQDAANNPPKGSHGLCPYFYLSAFDHPFIAVDQPKRCSSKRPASFWPENFKMGYTETRKPSVEGELFAITGNIYPFNIGRHGTNTDNIRPVKSLINERIQKVRPVVNTIRKAKALLRFRP